MSGVRKRLLDDPEGAVSEAGELDLTTQAVVAYSSEDPVHPVEHLFDGRHGPGGSYWASAQPDVPAQLVIEFDQPRSLSRLVYEVEETQRERTQEVRVEASTDGGRTYRQVLVQKYTFSP